jgi:hypothetical protein
MTFTRTIVEDAWLDVNDGTIIPVASFTVQYKVDFMPSAEIIPALGRDLATGNIATLENLQEEQSALLYLRINGEDRLMLSGYVAQIMASDNAGLFERKVSAKIIIHHRAVKLSGSPGLSYAYTSAHNATLAALDVLRSRVDPVTGQEIPNYTQPFFDFTRAGGGRQDTTVVQYPSSFLKTITEALIENNGPEELPEDLIQSYDPANLTPLGAGLDFTNVAYAIYGKYAQDWGQRNTWEALVSVCKMLYLHLIFYNEGFYIANPNSLINTPQKNILSDEYYSISETRMRDINKSAVDGVVLRHPFAKLKNKSNPNILAVYPKIKQEIAQANGEDLPAPDKFYHFADIPMWLQNSARAHWADDVKKVNRGTAKGASKKAKRDQPLTEYYETVGDRVAKAMYAEMQAVNATVQLNMPYREDLMPGTMVSIENSDTLNIKFMGETIYGMIETTVFKCDVMSNSPDLSTFIHVSAARTEKDNQAPEEGYGLTEHPIYEGIWVGTDLFGNLIAGQPAHQAAPNNTTNVNNANAGGSAGRRPSGQVQRISPARAQQLNIQRIANIVNRN